MIVPIKIRGKPASAVIDTGAQVTIVNSQFFDSLNCSLPSEPVILKGIDPERSVEGYVVRKVPLTLGRRSYKWDLYVAAIEDELLLGIDFMVYHKVDPLISRNVLLIDGQHEVPAKFKRNVYQNTGECETYEIGRVKVNKRVGISPLALTTRKHPGLIDVVQMLMPDRLLLETDAPYLPGPANLGYEGVGSPTLLYHIAAQVTKWRESTVEEVLLQAQCTTLQFYKL